MDYQEWVINWFVKHSSATKEVLEKNKDVNYFDMGYIDSFEFIELIGDIEELGIELDNACFEDRKFATISGLSEILNR